jgi:DNA-binding transcriptional MerR regulator
MVAEMQVGELAKRLDLNTQTIRYYERIGILPEPKRTAAGYRLYGEEDERRLLFIKNARNAGLALGEIKKVLAFCERGEPPCDYVREVVSHKAQEVERKIAELTKFKRELDALHKRATKRSALELRARGYCHIIENESEVS